MRILPYLSFDGSAREAMEHYRDALGGELDSLKDRFGKGWNISIPPAEQGASA